MLGDLVLYALNLVLCALSARTKAPQDLRRFEDDEQSTKF